MTPLYNIDKRSALGQLATDAHDYIPFHLRAILLIIATIHTILILSGSSGVRPDLASTAAFGRTRRTGDPMAPSSRVDTESILPPLTGSSAGLPQTKGYCNYALTMRALTAALAFPQLSFNRVHYNISASLERLGIARYEPGLQIT